MTNNNDDNIGSRPDQGADKGLSLSDYTRWLHEVENQPSWRSKADREMEYVDGNQLNSEVLQKQGKIGMPPAIEPLIGPAIDSVLGLEAKTRTDWRITSDNAADGDDVAAALNYKLNQAERHAGADRACSDAFKSQLCVGLGWVEVARESDPFKFPIRCKSVHRNEIFWDMLSVEPDLSDARYLIRRRWTDASQAKLKFPGHGDLIDRTMGRWTDRLDLMADGGTSTDLAMSALEERGWSIEEQQWRDCENARVCLAEVWYRRWEEVVVLKMPDGRVVEYDKTNAMHVQAVALQVITPRRATVSRMHCAYWLGPHKLHDGKTPYRHNDFPYAPFWGKREDRTGVPYGVVRGMIYLQDSVNSAISKIRWGLSAVRTIRTEGAVAYPDEIFRQQVSRVDSDIILNAEHMAQAGAMFKVERDFQLNEQQYKMLMDARNGIQRASGITAGFQGQQGSATSGIQESTQVEQATQSLVSLMTSFRDGRTKVGELLMSMIIEDMTGKEESVTVQGNAVAPDRTILLNQSVIDESTGIKYLTNDVSRVRLKVALDDVPSTPSFRKQQSVSLAEAFKSLPAEYQPVVLPHLLSLMDIPDKDQVLKAIQEVKDRPNPEIEQIKADNEFRDRELLAKYNPEKLQAEIAKLVSDTVASGIKSAFGGIQAGQLIAQMPAIAPVADVILQNAGWRPPTPAGVDPNLPQPDIAVPQGVVNPGDTSPQTPSDPSSPMIGQNEGINTMRSEG